MCRWLAYSGFTVNLEQLLSRPQNSLVAEPLGGLHGAWREVPESTCLTAREGHEELRPFESTVPQIVG